MMTEKRKGESTRECGLEWAYRESSDDSDSGAAGIGIQRLVLYRALRSWRLISPPPQAWARGSYVRVCIVYSKCFEYIFIYALYSTLIYIQTFLQNPFFTCAPGPTGHHHHHQAETSPTTKTKATTAPLTAKRNKKNKKVPQRKERKK